MMKKSADVIIIGAGIIGAACAWRLASTGAKVNVYDRNAPGTGASQAALGLLGFHNRPEMPAPFNEMCHLSRNYYPATIEKLFELTGRRLDYREGGQLSIAFDEEDLVELDKMYHENTSQDISVERPTREEALQLAPGLNPEVKGSLFFPDDSWVDNTALNQAFVRASELVGAVYKRGEVQSIERALGRVIGIRVAGELIKADWVVLAAGCWSNKINNVPLLPLYPVRGQALMVSGQSIQRVVMSPRGYLVPKGKSQTMIGATVERVGFNESNTLGGLQELSYAGLEIAPLIGRSEFLGAWAGLRPGTEDNLPLIGPFKELPNLIAATGHFRNGILFSPLTADMVKAAIVGSDSPISMEPFRPDRTP
jgi:glycine oxidase